MRLKWTTKNLQDLLPPLNDIPGTLEGMDRFLEDLDFNADLMVDAKPNEAYPPYNIVSTDSDNRSQIEIAVVGFGEDEIDITLEDDNILHVKGERIIPDLRKFAHKGIASRKFHRMFKLRSNYSVGDASLVDGLLTITLKKNPEKTEGVRIPIQGKKVFLAETGTQTK